MVEATIKVEFITNIMIVLFDKSSLFTISPEPSPEPESILNECIKNYMSNDMVLFFFKMCCFGMSTKMSKESKSF